MPIAERHANIVGRDGARVRTSGEIKRGTLFAPIHWSSLHASEARVGALVSSAVDPLSGEPEFKHTPARVEPFASRKRYGSIPAACASSSTSCSDANVVGGAPGARSAEVLKNVSNTGSDFPVTRRFGMSYCVPEFATDALPSPGGSSGTPTAWLVGPAVIDISGMPKAV